MSHEPIFRATLDLARDLISRRSITPADGGCVALLAERLSRIGFRCERIDRGGVTNLWARRGDARPLVCIAGHVDVVPPGPIEQWVSDPFVPVERDGQLVGRGAADMKGGLAAAITAIERVVTARPDHSGSIGVIVTSDEEGSAVDGTAAVVDALRARAETIDCCVLTEPTCSDQLGDTIKNGRRGSLNGRLAVHGVQGHVAYPELADNPVHAAARAIAALVEEPWGRDERADSGMAATSFQISNVHAGAGAVNVIPPVLEVLFNFRFTPSVTVDTLKRRVETILEHHKLTYRLEWHLSGLPFATAPGRLVDAVRRAIRDVTGVDAQLSTGGGTSDGRFLKAIAAELVEFGPLNATIHKANECVALADLAPLSKIYEQVLRELTDG